MVARRQSSSGSRRGHRARSRLRVRTYRVTGGGTSALVFPLRASALLGWQARKKKGTPHPPLPGHSQPFHGCRAVGFYSFPRPTSFTLRGRWSCSTASCCSVASHRRTPAWRAASRRVCVEGATRTSLPPARAPSHIGVDGLRRKKLDDPPPLIRKAQRTQGSYTFLGPSTPHTARRFAPSACPRRLHSPLLDAPRLGTPRAGDPSAPAGATWT